MIKWSRLSNFERKKSIFLRNALILLENYILPCNPFGAMKNYTKKAPPFHRKRSPFPKSSFRTVRDGIASYPFATSQQAQIHFINVLYTLTRTNCYCCPTKSHLRWAHQMKVLGTIFVEPIAQDSLCNASVIQNNFWTFLPVFMFLVGGNVARPIVDSTKFHHVCVAKLH